MENDVKKELEQFTAIYQLMVEFVVTYSVQIFAAIIIMILGVFVARKAGTLVFNLLEKKEFDVTLSRFISSVVRLTIIVMVVIISLEKIGISVTPFLAIVGALSLGAGLAVQGVLSNYGAGLNIIITRPFVVGDTIQVRGVSGQVKEVHLAYTVLVDEDETQINIPNKQIVGEIIHNSHLSTLAEVTIGIAYSEDANRAIDIINNTLAELNIHPQAPKGYRVGIEGFGDSSVNIGIRAWLPTQRYYHSLYLMNNKIYSALKEHDVCIPFPQREVRILDDAVS